MAENLGIRGRVAGVWLVTLLALVAGQAAIGSAQAATTTTVAPTSPEGAGYSAPFGQTSAWPPYYLFVYRNIPAFTLKTGDTVAFDLSAQNDVDIQLEIDLAATTTNGGDVAAEAFTQVVPNTQVPVNPRGNTTTGDYELTFTAQAPFSFPGGGLLIRFSHPGGAFATDPNATGAGVLINTALASDPSGFFVERVTLDSDGVAPYDGLIFTNGIGGFRLNIADVPPQPASTPTATPTATPKKCKKKKHRSVAVSAKKCKKKKR